MTHEYDPVFRRCAMKPPEEFYSWEAVAEAQRDRAERAEAKLVEIRAVTDRWQRAMPGIGDGLCGAAILSILDRV